jgi:Uma2 family endonuclease
MPLTVGDRDVRPLTADEVMRMVETGILAEDEPVELLHGVLTAVSPKTPAHGVVLSRLLTWLGAGATAGRYTLRTEHPLSVPDRTSLPEPDLAVIAPGVDLTSTHPRTALLIVEVSVTSLRLDATVKPALYAAAGVPEYWVVDVPGRFARIFSAPEPAGYGIELVTGSGTIRPQHVDAPPLDLASLFAGLPPGDAK